MLNRLSIFSLPYAIMLNRLSIFSLPYAIMLKHSSHSLIAGLPKIFSVAFVKDGFI